MAITRADHLHPRTLAWRAAPLLLSALMIVASVAFLVLRASSPDDCTKISSWQADGVSVTVSAMCQPGATPLHDDDLVTAIDGRPLPEATGALTSSVGDIRDYTVLRDGRELTVPVTLTRPDLIGALVPLWSSLLFVLLFFAMAAYLVWRKRDAVTGALLLAAAGFATSTPMWWLGLPAVGAPDEAFRWLQVTGNTLFYTAGWAGGLAFALLFPRPFRRLSGWPDPARWALYAAPFWFVTAWAVMTAPGSINELDYIGRQQPAIGLAEVGTLLAWIGVGVWRLRQPMDAVTRQQMRWLVGGVLLAATGGLAGWFLPQVLIGEGLPPELSGLTGLFFLVGLAVAVLRYRLFDLEIVLNRGLVYGLLTAGVATLYFGVVAIAAGMLGRDTTTPAAIVATAVVAVTVNPLRLLLQRTVDRLMYGDRDDPYSALSRLERRLDATGDQDRILSSVAEDVTDALRVPYAEIDVGERHVEAGTRPRWLTGENGLFDIPLTDGAERIGRMSIAPRAPGAAFSRADQQLAYDLARRVSAAARELSLRADLQRSRERLVLAREEERRALRRALHDEFGPIVAGLSLRTEAARRIIDTDADAAMEALGMVRTDAENLVADMRRLAYDLRPPALDELGLADALRQYAREIQNPPVTVTGDGISALPAAVEAAAYRIAVEAVSNTVRHANASRCDVTLAHADATLVIDVSDDGRGLPPDFTAGVGVSAMRERAAELGGHCRLEGRDGGGTRLYAVLPTGRSTS